MTTIHALPPELITHILTLAYDTSSPFAPPDAQLHQAAYTHAKAGLRAAALVHSSWRAPAEKLMTAELHFGKHKPGVLARFLACAPAGFACARLELVGLTVGEMEGLLGRAREGGVRGLRLFGRMPVGLFGLPALSDLGALQLGWLRQHSHPLPTTLTYLKLTAPDPFPSELIAASAYTLTTLDLSLRHASHLPLLAGLAPSLSSLRHLALDCCAPELAVSDHAAVLERLVSHLSRLRSLRLPPLWPALLERVLRALPPHVRLRRLKVEVVVAEEAEDESARLEGQGGWLAGLERCARLQALGELEELDVGIGLRTAGAVPVWWALDGDNLAAFMAQREGQRERWDRFRARMRETGVKLLCWGLPYEEQIDLISLPRE